MGRTQTLRHQHRYLFANNFFRLITEDLPQRLGGKQYLVVFIDGDNGFRGGLHNHAITFFAAPQRRFRP